MGKLVEGKWQKEVVNPTSKSGEFQRQEQKFRDVISETSAFKPEKDRYHLYVSYACPWAHRTLIMRSLKGLEEIISVSIVSPYMFDEGWTFADDFPHATGDKLYQSEFLREIYIKADDKFTGKVTVPVLFDKKTQKIVNNESSEILHIFNSAFDKLTGNHEDFYPEELRHDIDEWNEFTYEAINNGVYKTGFATTTEAYKKNYKILFDHLDELEIHLSGKSFLVGERLTIADIRLYPTLLRFDDVYYSHFKCNASLIKDYPNLSIYLKTLFKMKGFYFEGMRDHIKNHYYGSHKNLNPTGIVPIGPSPWWEA